MATTPEGLVRAWVNAQSSLVGPGHPLTKGAHLHRQRGAAPVTYAWLSQIGGGGGLGAEVADVAARISAAVYGRTKEDAATAATAYRAALDGLSAGFGVRAVFTNPAGTVLTVDAITGPLYQPDLDEDRYIVDADFYLQLG